MSDDEVQQTKKGRRGATATESSPAKRNKKEAKIETSDDGDEPSVKRGRGRPKGAPKKAAKPAKATNGVGRRGRSSKKAKEVKEDSPDEDEKSSAEETDE